jgi:glutamine amidotransferase
MARLLGFIGNRPDLGAKIVELEAPAFAVRAKAGVTPGWGVGFWQGGEILLKRRPIDDRAVINLASIASDIRADALIAHVRLATIGAPRTENTHPFRYRQWLFAHTGTLPAFDRIRGRLAESLPQFLLRDVRGETDSELLFHLFLSFLHDAGELDRPTVAASVARAALRSSVSLVDRLCAEDGAPASAMNVLLLNGEYLLALHSGARMGYRKFHGQRDLERLFGDGGLGRMRIPDYQSSWLDLVASDFDDDRLPPDWTEIDTRAMVTFSHGEAPAIEPL